MIARRATFAGRFLLHELLIGLFAGLSDVNYFVFNVFTVQNHENTLLTLLHLEFFQQTFTYGVQVCGCFSTFVLVTFFLICHIQSHLKMH